MDIPSLCVRVENLDRSLDVLHSRIQEGFTKLNTQLDEIKSITKSNGERLDELEAAAEKRRIAFTTISNNQLI